MRNAKKLVPILFDSVLWRDKYPESAPSDPEKEDDKEREKQLKHYLEFKKHKKEKEQIARGLWSFLYKQLGQPPIQSKDNKWWIYLGPGTTTRIIGKQLIESWSSVSDKVQIMTNNLALALLLIWNRISWLSPPGEAHIPNASIDDREKDGRESKRKKCCGFRQWMESYPPHIAILGISGFDLKIGFAAYSSMKCPADCAKEMVIIVGDHLKLEPSLAERTGGLGWLTFNDIKSSCSSGKRYFFILNNPGQKTLKALRESNEIKSLEENGFIERESDSNIIVYSYPNEKIDSVGG